MKSLMIGAVVLAGLAFAPVAEAMPVGAAVDATASVSGDFVSPARWGRYDRGMHRGWTRGHRYGWGRGRWHRRHWRY